MRYHHIDENGDYQSDKFKFLGPNWLLLNLEKSDARVGARAFADVTGDEELAEDLIIVCDNLDIKQGTE